MKIAFIINPHAGINQNAFQATERDVQRFLKNHETVLYSTKEPHDATRAALQFAHENFDIVVSVGGDGTANETAQGLMGTETAFCLLPYGSGNGLARGYKLPMNPKRIIEQLPYLTKYDHDVWQLADGDQIRPFFGFAGIGYDAFIGHLFNQRKGRRGLLTYVYLIMAAYKKYRPVPLHVRTSKREFSMTPFVFAMGNTNEYGNGALIAPDANSQDGILDITIMKTMTFTRGLFNGWRLFNGTVGRVRDVEMMRLDELTIRPQSTIFYHTDGEPYQTQNEITIRKHADKLIVLHP